MSAQSLALAATLAATGMLNPLDHIQSDPSAHARLTLAAFVAMWSFFKLTTRRADKILRFMLAWPPASLSVHFFSVCAGAPFFRVASQTAHFSALLGALLVVPLVDSSRDGMTGNILMQWLSSLDDLGIPLQRSHPIYSATLQIYCTAVGCLCGLWPLPMDWAKPWQVWPTSVMLGASFGNGIGQLLAAAVVLFPPPNPDNVKLE